MRATILASVVAGAVAFAGCTEQQVNDAGNAAASAAPKLANDGRILARIESRFASIDATSALHVAVAVDGGNVRLRGKVLSGAIEGRFVTAAEHVPGVKGFDADLHVDPTLPKPEVAVRNFALSAAVHANLAAQGGVNALRVRVDARDGVITLAGTVPSAAVQTTMVDAARTTAGVGSVVDHLKVGS